MIRPQTRPILPCAAALAALLAAPAAPAPAADTAPRAAIQAAYDQLDAAFVQRDMDRFMSFFAPDFTEQTPKGETRSRDRTRQGYQDQLRQIKTMRCRFAIQSLTPTPGGALVEMKMHADGTGEKRILFAKVRGTFTNDLWVRDLWVRTPQGWRLKHRQTLQDETRTHPG